MQVGAASAYAVSYTQKAIIASLLPLYAMTAPLTLFSLPLFPLRTVLFPGGVLPLRVFEPRYRSMVRGCLEQGAPFGVATLLNGSDVQSPGAPAVRFHTVGTMARIDAVEALHSGMVHIQCSGQERFRITDSRQLASGLWVADVALLTPDRPTPVPDDLAHTVATLRRVLHQLPQHHFHHASDAQFADCSWVANRWCELFPMAESLQLNLLELDSPLLRLELITDALKNSGIVLQPKKHSY